MAYALKLGSIARFLVAAAKSSFVNQLGKLLLDEFLELSHGRLEA
jgi:hypothetical protein